MNVFAVLCAVLCILSALISDISARPKKGGEDLRITTVSPEERASDQAMCEVILGNITEVDVKLNEYPCREAVIARLAMERDDASSIGIDISSEGVDDSSEENITTFKYCSRCAKSKHGCGKRNRNLATKLSFLEDCLDLLDDEGCPATTAEPYEMTSEGATEESTNGGTTESPEDVTV